jgi:ParB-like chromosome segregation protein Spo0J
MQQPEGATNQAIGKRMLEDQTFKIDDIYVPVKRRKTLNPETVQELAKSILESGKLTPILVRRDGERLVLVEGLHRLEACKALGETTIVGLLVQARQH